MKFFLNYFATVVKDTYRVIILKSYTLESAINAGLCLLIFGFFLGATFLIKGGDV